MTLLFTDPRFADHDTGPGHPERPQRLHRVWARLEREGLTAQCQRRPFAPLTAEETYAVHEPQVAAFARELAAAGGGRLDPDTPVSPVSVDVALLAAGACCAAVDAVLAGEANQALCLVRPPGHHATPTRSMGFCLFNNIALAARRAQTRGLSRVLVVDWDVHHGNGTQDAFYDDGAVSFLSIHRYGDGFYPGTGAAHETGTGRGLGTIANVPVRFGTSREEYLARFRNAVTKLADACKPELVLLSAGFDAHALDPVGSLGLETEDYVELTQFLREVAATHAGGRLVSCLEGGYHLDALAECVQAHLETLLG